MDEIAEVFQDPDDPRTGKAKRHSLHEIVVIGLCTVLCGGESCADMALFGRSRRASAPDGTTISSLACFHSSPELKCDSPALTPSLRSLFSATRRYATPCSTVCS